MIKNKMLACFAVTSLQQQTKLRPEFYIFDDRLSNLKRCFKTKKKWRIPLRNFNWQTILFSQPGLRLEVSYNAMANTDKGFC